MGKLWVLFVDMGSIVARVNVVLLVLYGYSGVQLVFSDLFRVLSFLGNTGLRN